MPLRQINEDDKKAALKEINQDVLALWAENGMHELLQATLAKAGCTTLGALQRIGASEAGVSKACKHMGLSEDDGLTEIIMIGTVQSAWEAAKIVHTSILKAKADKQVMGIPQTLLPSEVATVEKTYEREHGRLPKEELLGAPIIERIELEMQNGLLIAPRLIEIPSRVEVEKATGGKIDAVRIAVTFTAAGPLLQQPLKVKAPMPNNTEEYRARIDLLCRAIEYIKIRKPTAVLWMSSNESVWREHTNFIFGPKVRGVKVEDLNGKVCKTPIGCWSFITNSKFGRQHES